MGRLLLYILPLLFIFAIHGKSINYFSNSLFGYSIIASENILWEEENKEEKKSEKEFEKEFEEFFLDNISTLNHQHESFSYRLSKNKTYFSDYKKVIFSPPEIA